MIQTIKAMLRTKAAVLATSLLKARFGLNAMRHFRDGRAAALIWIMLPSALGGLSFENGSIPPKKLQVYRKSTAEP